jgi:molybdenum cofactor cytidylyltransferase
MKIAALILAAGRSSRFEGGNKLLADFDGRPVIHHVVTAISAAPVDDIILVTAPGGGKIVAAAGPGRWRSAVNPNAGLGLSSSIQTGLASLDPATDGALIVLADMPRLTSSLIAQLCAAFDASNGTAIVFPQTPDGRQGNPVLWPRALFPELMAPSGDIGGKAVLAKYRELHCPVTIDGDAVLFDIDTKGDLGSDKL